MELTQDTNELLQAQTSLWTHIFNHIDSMALKCAVELGIADAIDNHGGPISLPDLVAALGISSAKQSQLHRLMRALTRSGIFSSTVMTPDLTHDKEEVLYVYSLTPISTLLLTNKGQVNLSDFVLAALHPVLVNPFQSMSAWFKDDRTGITAFCLKHGCEMWEMTSHKPKFRKLFNDAMMSDSEFVMRFLLKDCGHVFKDVTSLMDVGGGTGATAISISKAFPDMRCSVLELPEVVRAVRDKGGVDFISGDMFDYVPHAHAVLLKWILHDWSDEDCVRILKRCKEAIPCREEGGKVIIIDAVMGCNARHQDSSTDKAQIYWDMMMMVACGGAERSESEWREIFDRAGFKCYKIVSNLGSRNVIEVYP